MFKAKTVFQWVLLKTIFIGCQVNFVVEEGVLRVRGNVEDSQRVSMTEICGVSSIDEESFEKLKNIKRMKIDGCTCAEMIINWVCNHTQCLIELELVDNSLKSLPEDIGKLVHLVKLDLSFNQLPSLPDAIGKLVNLNKLSVYSNKLSSLPDAVRKLSELVEIDLANNQFESLPESICDFVNLSYLDISNNRLTSLPEAIGKLVNLCKIHAYGNQLSSLPETIGCLKHIEEIDLCSNVLTTIPESIGDLEKLQYIDLSLNLLTTLPESVGNLKALLYLYVQRNRLESIPESIENLESLNSIDLRHNLLVLIPESIGNLRNLEEMNLKENQIVSIPESIENLESLKHINLCDNLLTLLPNTICNLRNLKKIYLRNNQITSLPLSFNTMSQITRLDLKRNPTLDTTEHGLGKIDLQRIFGNRVVFSQVKKPFVEISMRDLYKKLREKELCWNFCKLRIFRQKPVQTTTLDKDGMIKAVYSLAENDKISKRLCMNELGEVDDPDYSVLIEYIEKLYNSELEYKRWPMMRKYTELTKNLLGCILERMAVKDYPFDLGAVVEAVRGYCPDRQMAELKQGYQIVMGQKASSDTLEDFVSAHIAAEKRHLFDLAILPGDSDQNVHVLNYWKHKLGDELGFNPNFITAIRTTKDDPFQDSDANALDAFFSAFTPEFVIGTLTEAINSRNSIICELAMLIHCDDSLTAERKAEMFLFKDILEKEKNGEIQLMIENAEYNGITQKAVEYYLIKETIIIRKDSKGASKNIFQKDSWSSYFYDKVQRFLEFLAFRIW